MRILGLLKAEAGSEAGELPTADLMVRMAAFMDEVSKTGILLATDGLKPSSFGKRVKLDGGALSVTDGPFTESKELIASYALFQVDTMDEAVAWTKRFLEVLGSGECELRPVFEFTDFPEDLFPPEAVAQEQVWRDEMAGRAASTGA